MGTKNNPGEFDCYGNAEPDEPMFILLGRDRHAPFLVEVWALLRHLEGEDEAKVTEALDCADDMRDWLDQKGKRECDAAVLELVPMMPGAAHNRREWNEVPASSEAE